MQTKYVYKLTNPQKNIWHMEQYYKGTAINNICGSVLIKEKIDLDILSKAINIFIENNDSFRTRIILIDGTPHQYFIDNKIYEFETNNFQDVDAFHAFAKAKASIPFEIMESQLFDFNLFTLPNGYGGFIINAHHIISDAATFAMIGTEVTSNYVHLKKNEDIPVKDFSYKCYIEAEQKYEQSPRFEKDKAYWDALYSNVPDVATIPSAMFSNNKESISASRLDFEFDKSFLNEITEFCRSQKISVYNFLIAVYSIYLGRVNNTDYFSLGTPILNRSNYAEKHTSGMFISTSLLTIETKHNPTIGDFMHNISQISMSMLKHQKYDYQHILDNLRKTSPNTPNLFDVLLSYQITKATDTSLGIPYESTWYGTPYLSNSMDIHFHDNNDEGTLIINYDYQICKYSHEDIKALHSRILWIIRQVLDNSSLRLSDIEIVTLDEKNKILYDFNKTDVPYQKDKTIVTLFEDQVAKTPKHTAVVFEEKSLTYKELNEKANSLAHFLKDTFQISRNDIVGIMVNRSIEMIVAILAVLKAGGAYIPIDPSFPKDRINYMLKNSNAKLLLTQRHLKDAVDYKNTAFVDLDNTIYGKNTSNLKNVNQPNDLAYIIFTSGSTGAPKGVMLKHKSLTNLAHYCNNYIEYLKKPSNIAIASITTISFDIFIFETLISLGRGLKVVIANENEQMSPSLLNKLIEKNDIKIVQSTPSRMQIFINNKHSMPCLKNLKYITLAGEQLPLSLVQELTKLCNPVIYNGYGPSETTVFSTLTKMENDKITIGKPLNNTQIYILDNNLKPVPIGVAGEIYISGDGVGKGYIHNKDLTYKSFIQNPYIPNTIMYKTGDLGMYTPNGEIICLGRSDNQVKIRGLRIELEEIENKMQELEEIDACVVVKKESEKNHEFLCAYYTASTEISSSSIRKHLEKSLPRYMVPSYFIELKAMPYTPNGKIDRNHLPEPEITNEKKIITKPRNEVENTLVEILEAILKKEEISIDDNLFDLGFDSLSAINLCIQVEEKFKIELFVKEVLEHPIVSELSDIISKKSTVKKDTITPLPKADFYITSAAQKRIYYASKVAGADSTLYNIPGGVILNMPLDVKKLESAIQALVQRHESFRTYFEIVNSNLVQKIAKNIEFKLQIQEKANFDEIDILFKKFVKPFTLEKAPLFRAKYITFLNGKSAIFIDMHHTISDGTSISIFVDELSKLYNGENLAKHEISYKDFSAYENNKLKSGKFKEAEEYWVKQFNDEIPLLNMPTTYVRPATKNYEGSKIHSVLDEKTTQKIKQICKSLGLTPYMLLLANYYILLSKYTSQNDIVIGSPIVGRSIDATQNIIGMFVNNLPLRNKIDGNLTFNDFVLNLKETVLEAYKYQDYPYDELISKLKIKTSANRNPLFDTMFIYQNEGYSKINFENIPSKNYIPDTNISKFDLSLEAIPDISSIKLCFEYSKQLFSKDFIKQLSSHYLNILNIVLDNINTKIDEIDLLSEEEKNQILHKFNSPSSDLNKSPQLITMFENQAKKAPNNIAVVFESNKLTYKELNERANSLANYLKSLKIENNDTICVLLNRSLELIVSIYGVIKSGASYVLIDPSLPQERINYIINDCMAKYTIVNEQISNQVKLDNTINISSIDFSIYNVQNLSNKKYDDNLCLVYTSGSTGNPKGVLLHKHGFANLVQAFDKKIGISKYKKVLGLASVNFDMFASDLFIATLLGNTFVLANEEEQKNPLKMSKLILKNNIDFFVTTPSRLELLLNTDAKALSNVKTIILGGEKFSPKLYKKIKKVTNADIYNGYGPTEITACCTLKLIFSTKNITIGVPISNVQAYICDKNMKLQPIGVLGEICIAGEGVSNGYLHNEDATKKSFIKNPFGSGMLYKTGDLGKFTANGEIEYIGRADNQIKIRGIRIELEEIENKINKLPFINSCVVLKKSNEQEHEFLCAYFTANDVVNPPHIRRQLEAELPRYMIPSYFVQLENMPQTPNGKIDRSNLPEPDYTSRKKAIIPPRNDTDSKLIKMIQKLLGIEPIGINDDFFELGGDSLSAINLCVQVQSKFDVQLSVRNVLEHPMIYELSDIISKSSVTKATEKITPVPKADFYEASSAQKRIYFASNFGGNSSILYNTPGGIVLETPLDTSLLEKCLQTLINRHESFRTYFELQDGNVVQKIKGNCDFKLDVCEKVNFEDIELNFREFIKPFNLNQAPLIRLKYITFTNGKAAIFIDIHHIISDGLSMKIFADELCKLYKGEALPDIDITYKDFSAFENKALIKGDFKEAEKYWLEQFKGELPVLNMPTKAGRPAVQCFEGNKVHSCIDLALAKKIEVFSKKIGVTPYMMLLAAYYILLSKYTSNQDIIVGSPIANRNMPQTASIIGMFANTLALRSNVDSNLSFKDYVLSIKSIMLEAYKYQAYPFDELVEKLNIKRDPSRNPLFDTMFIYQNEGFTKINLEETQAKYYLPDTRISKFDLSLELIPTDGKIDFSFEYANKLFDKSFIEKLANHYIKILEVVLDNIDEKIANVDILPKSEKEQIIYGLNNTTVKYNANKTIINLFEEQVAKTPRSIALIFGNRKMTYKELNQKANSLAHYLRINKGLERNDLVGIMVNRSMEMIVAILAVLKAGGAYIPIDPTFPKDRINYMLKNSNCKLLLTQKQLQGKTNSSCEIFVDLSNKKLYKNSTENLNLINEPDDLSYVIFTSGSTGMPKGVMLTHKALSNLTNYCNNYIEYLKEPSNMSIVSITTISFDIFIFETLISLQRGLQVVIANENEQTTPHLLDNLIEKYDVKIIQSTPSRMQIFLNNQNSMPHLNNLKYIILAGEQLPLNLVQELDKICNPVIYNGYGPSETTVFSTLTKMEGNKITIGKPLDNTQMYILDNNLKPVPMGVSGEIYISGDGVGKGYLNNADLTNKSFLANPFIKNSIMYKTGDLGFYNSDGEIICLGRADNQVKIRGLRIELEEVEAVIQNYPNIEKAIVVKQSIDSREFISAYYVAKKKIDISALRRHISSFLPRYMVPSYFTKIYSMPYTPNGKIDRKNLPVPTEILSISKEAYVAPQTELQKNLVQIWEKLLNAKKIGINDNFFELGGDSLLAMNLNVELLKLSKNITYQDIFRYPTIADLEQKIKANSDKPYFSKIENLSDSFADVLKACTTSKRVHKYRPKGILLTGSTGFLGIHILEEFIKREKCNIYCIVREGKEETSRARLLKKLNYYFGDKYNNLVDKRIFALNGDIVNPGFGLNQEELLNLANSVDVVIHSAANVAHFGDYKSFYNTNVKSVKYIVDFCTSFSKKIYHISTVSVADRKLDLSYPAFKNEQKVKFDEASLYIGQTLDNVYARTKFEAETVVLKAISQGLNGYILRMGHLMPRLRDGKFQDNASSNDFVRKVLDFMKIESIPDYLLNYTLDFTPVDKASRAIHKIITHTNNTNRIFHLYNPNNVQVKKFLSVLKKSNYNVEVLPEYSFKSKVQAILDNDEEKKLIKNLINDFNNDLHLDYKTDIIIKSEFTIKYLRKTFFRWPIITRKYLSRFINILRREL